MSFDEKVHFLRLETKQDPESEIHCSSISFTSRGEVRIVGVIPHRSILLPTKTNVETLKHLATVLEHQRLQEKVRYINVAERCHSVRHENF